MTREVEKMRDEAAKWLLDARARIRSHADEAILTMLDLMHTSSSEAVRYQAAKDMLDRAGIRAPQAVQVDVDIAVRQQEMQQVDAEIDAIFVRLGRNQLALEAPNRITPSLDSLIVLEGDDEDLVIGDLVVDAIDTTATEDLD